MLRASCEIFRELGRSVSSALFSDRRSNAPTLAWLLTTSLLLPHNSGWLRKLTFVLFMLVFKPFFFPTMSTSFVIISIPIIWYKNDIVGKTEVAELLSVDYVAVVLFQSDFASTKPKAFLESPKLRTRGVWYPRLLLMTWIFAWVWSKTEKFAKACENQHSYVFTLALLNSNAATDLFDIFGIVSGRRQ